MEIERKFQIDSGQMPLSTLKQYPFHRLEQAYLYTAGPVVRIRREDDSYYMTYKSGGTLAHREDNLPLTADAYRHLLTKADGNIISKCRYLVPLPDGLTAEVDVFEGSLNGLIFAEVEFETVEQAKSFVAPSWFGKDVTYDKHYHNSNLSSMTEEEFRQWILQ